MKVSGKMVPYLRKSTLDVHWTEGWAGTRTSLDDLAKKRISCPCWESTQNSSLLEPLPIMLSCFIKSRPIRRDFKTYIYIYIFFFFFFQNSNEFVLGAPGVLEWRGKLISLLLQKVFYFRLWYLKSLGLKFRPTTGVIPALFQVRSSEWSQRTFQAAHRADAEAQKIIILPKSLTLWNQM
jgi:hypothetical protein